jgi:hypothetical protein
MKRLAAAIAVLVFPVASASAGDPPELEVRELDVDGQTWLGAVHTPFQEAWREHTKKVFTHIYDFEGEAPITKGVGGKYSHHRGMFIGWRETRAGGGVWDTWHCPESYQEHARWLEAPAVEDGAAQRQEVFWREPGGEPFLQEIRTLAARPGPNGARVFDFTSELRATGGKVELRGDLQHAGMQVRLANEVSQHEDTTRYLLPAGAEERDNDKVVGGWWACCSAVIRGKRYWLAHMTPPDHPTGEPVYSIRRYGRFGAFFETDIEPGQPLTVTFRLVLSQKPMNQETCEALYETYAAERAQP